MLLALLSLAASFVHAAPQPAPELAAEVYKARREQVLHELSGCVAVIAAQGAPSGVTDDFKQDPDFFWLTGVNEPQAFLLFAPQSKYSKTTLYLKHRDPEAENWTGPREPLSPGLTAKYGVDRVRRGTPGGAMLEAAQSGDCVAILAPALSPKDDRGDVSLTREVAGALGLRVVYKRDLLARLRAAHSHEEIALMEQAIAITRLGHEAAARATVSGVSERDVQTQIEYAFFGSGATGLSYSSIVGSGENGAVLHWDQNSRMLRSGDLVVVDAAAEYGHYAADVTRTYPVSGKFSDEEAKVYRAVYQAQEEIFQAIKPGVSMVELQKVAEDSLRKSGYLEHFIHGFGHFVGLDVHDAGSYDAPLPVGAIITVEPGVYLRERGFGVRIEDEVLVTPKGYRLLTDQFPRKLEDVEAWVARARK